MKKPTKWRDFLKKSPEEQEFNTQSCPPCPPQQSCPPCPPPCPPQQSCPPCPPPCPPQQSCPPQQPCPPCPPYQNPCLCPCPPDRRCYPFDAFGLEKCTPSTDEMVNTSQGLEIPVLIDVTVPTGFVLPQGISYTSHLAVDKSDLSIGVFTQYFVCTTTNDPVNPNTKMVKTQVAKLSGPMYYNLTLNGFIPQKTVTDTEAVISTYVNETGYFDVEYILAYLAPNATQVPNYSIEARLVNTKVLGNLQDPSTNKSLQFTFVFKIQVLPESIVVPPDSTEPGPVVPPSPSEPGIQPLSNIARR